MTTDLPTRTPHFFAEDGAEMFYYAVDERNVIGPRPATGRDRFEHAGAYRAFKSAELAGAEDVKPAKPSAEPKPATATAAPLAAAAPRKRRAPKAPVK